MKKVNHGLIIFTLLAGTLFPGEVLAEATPQLSGNNDGPYIIYDGENATILRLQKSVGGAQLVSENKTVADLRAKEIEVVPDSEFPPFSFKLFDYSADPAYVEAPKKIVAFSDLEGNFADFVRILIASGVMKEDYSWNFGKNHMVFNGDLFDRGTDVMALMWLCYKLDHESRLAGGRVHIILGNHEEMNLRGDIRYVDKRYTAFAAQAGIEYTKLFDENSEIGRWLRTKNGVTIIGKTLFVHGGISMEIDNLGVDPQQINDIVRANLGKDKTTLDHTASIIWGTSGTFWHRGLVLADEKYFSVPTEKMKGILDNFGVKRIVVGHSIVSEITALHGGKVIAVDVDHPENRDAEKSRALLIKRLSMKAINDKGELTKLPVLDSYFK